MKSENQIKPLGRITTFLQSLLALASVVPALFLFAYLSQVTGLNSPAIPPLGIIIPVLIASVFLWREGAAWCDLGLERPKSFARTTSFALLGTVAGFALFNVAVLITDKAGLPRPDVSVLQDMLVGNTGNYIQFMVLVVWGSAAIGEEMFARGFLLNRLEHTFSGLRGAWWYADVLQAVVFGLLHFYQGTTGMIATGLVGFIMALLFRFTGRNLIAPIIAHGLIDTVSITALYLGVVPD